MDTSTLSTPILDSKSTNFPQERRRSKPRIWKKCYRSSFSTFDAPRLQGPWLYKNPKGALGPLDSQGRAPWIRKRGGAGFTRTRRGLLISHASDF